MSWKHVPQLPKRFEANLDGEIRTLPYTHTYLWKHGKVTRRNPGKILKQRVGRIHKNAGTIRPIVSIYLGTSRGNDKTVPKSVARLVCAAHYGLPYDPKDQRGVQRWRVRHKDGDVMNCRADNLEWMYNVGEDGSGGATQARYEERLRGYDDWDPAETVQRLFAEVGL